VEVGAVTFFKLMRIETSETQDSTADCRKFPTAEVMDYPGKIRSLKYLGILFSIVK
jgi:hypothetical protein